VRPSGHTNCVSEIIFEVHEADEGGFWARALGHDIFTQGEDWNDLRKMVKEAVACHFESAAERPKLIRLHYVRDEVLAA
jgi:predicted RNase H-like HicB family nuclease